MWFSETITLPTIALQVVVMTHNYRLMKNKKNTQETAASYDNNYYNLNYFY